MRPRPYLAMKLIASGVANWAAIVRSPSFSRSSSSQTTTIRPRRMSSIASSIVENGPCVHPDAHALCLALRHMAHARSFPANGDTSRSTYLATMSHSTFSLSPAPVSPRVVLSRVSGIRETSAQDSPKSTTVRLDAVECDRSLLDHVAVQPRVEANSQPPGKAVLLGRDDRADAIDVALHDVPTEAIGSSHRQLQVDSVAGLQPSQRGHLQRLVHGLGLESIRVGGTRGQAGAVDGYRVAQRHLCAKPARNPQPCAVGAGVDRLDRPNVLDQPGEHPHHSLNRAVISTSSPTVSTLEDRAVWRAGPVTGEGGALWAGSSSTPPSPCHPRERPPSHPARSRRAGPER